MAKVKLNKELHEKFLKALHDKKVIKAKINSNSKGKIVRECIPFDFGPHSRWMDGIDRYHMYDLTSPSESHVVSIKPEQLLDVKILDRSFDPEIFITWKPNWHVKRDWGKKS